MNFISLMPQTESSTSWVCWCTDCLELTASEIWNVRRALSDSHWRHFCFSQ